MALVGTAQIRITNKQKALPHLVRYRDVLRTPDGDFTVCRVIPRRHYDEEILYVCTNGAETRVISDTDVFMLNFVHLRNGRLVTLPDPDPAMGEITRLRQSYVKPSERNNL